ncbi:MAG: hypothetical protein JXR71_10170 [Bacteroidales bacterium]|nr:hypothetical protein [Bacteroidales bacterium]
MAKESVTYKKAVALLKLGLTSDGYVASLDTRANYRRIWARDGVITGLASLLTGDVELMDGLKNTLVTLQKHQHQSGMIPSNVAMNDSGQVTSISYGTLTGKVDTALWFVLGVLIYVKHTGDREFLNRMKPSVEQVFSMLTTWEFNGRGLLYVPKGGNWADEFVLEGYNLSEQLLYYWALNEAKLLDETYQVKAERLKERIQINYWPEARNRSKAYHATAFAKQVKKGPVGHWMAGFNPGGYLDYYDCFAHALTLMLQLNTPSQQEKIIDSQNQIVAALPDVLLPSFWPVIREENSIFWQTLQSNWLFEFRNYPGHYQNGGVWPVFNGMLAAGLYRSGALNEAVTLSEALNKMVSVPEQRYGFYEYAGVFNGKPGGTRHQLWSAAGVIFAEKAAQDIFIV